MHWQSCFAAYAVAAAAVLMSAQAHCLLPRRFHMRGLRYIHATPSTRQMRVTAATVRVMITGVTQRLHRCVPACSCLHTLPTNTLRCSTTTVQPVYNRRCCQQQQRHKGRMAHGLLCRHALPDTAVMWYETCGKLAKANSAKTQSRGHSHAHDD